MKMRNMRALAVVGFHVLAFCLFQCDKKYITPSTGDAMMPVIDRITPESGSPGSVVTIEGNNFSTKIGDVEVRFNDNADDDIVKFAGVVAQIIEVSSTKLSVIVPPGAIKGKISVSVGGVKALTKKEFSITEQSNGYMPQQPD
jgi:hypothetical protein